MSSLLRLNDVGMIAAFAIAFVLLHRYRALPRNVRLPKQAYVGAAIVFGGHFLTLLGLVPVALFFTPIAWTGYILWIDAAIFSIRGESLLRSHTVEFAWLALCSIPLWIIFELYNLRLENWIYVGLPQNQIVRDIGYAWAFATIWPGIFETATLLRALGWNEPSTVVTQERPISASALKALLFGGLLLITVPLLAPPKIGAYLFGAVWLGFIFLLEPINYRTGRESLLRDLARGDSSRLRALLWSGLICGIFWEFWNYSAAARWFYTVPIWQDWKMFAMPLPGYLGFPPFALECFAMFALLSRWLRRAAKSEWSLFKL